MKGVVAAGHPLTAKAGADVLRDGGNAVDAALAAMLMSWVAESPLTGPGAGGFMLVHTSGGETHLLDFFVAAPGKDAPGPPGALEPIEVRFSEGAVQEFHVGPASCGVYGNPLGIAVSAKRFGSMPLADIAAPAARAAREGIEVTPMMRQFFEVLESILTHTEEARAIYAPEGSLLEAGETIRMPYVGDLIERLGSEGPAFLYEGDVARAVSDWVGARGGTITEQDLATYRVIEREPARARYHGRDILTNPPPSSGGILISYSLDLMERLGPAAEHRLRTLVRVMDRTNKERTRDFVRGLHSEGYLERFLAQEALESAAREVSNPLGNTTHLSVMDDNGASVSVTCSNGSGSGVVVPGTGLHLNNMLGEEDLNPEGHRHDPGRPRAEHDGAYARAARRTARACGGKRWVQPNSVGDPSDDHQRGRPRPQRAGRGGCAAASLRKRRRRGRGRAERAGARGPGARRLARGALAAEEPLLRRRAGGGAEPRDRRAVGRRRSAPGRRRRDGGLVVRLFAALVLAALLSAGCGGEAGDLMAIKVSPGATKTQPLDIVVESDGRAQCNDGEREMISSELLIEARELERKLARLIDEGVTDFPPTGPRQREYVVRIKAGTIRWSEGEEGIPRELPQTQLFTLRLDRLLCR